jgi:hypothetical protein
MTYLKCYDSMQAIEAEAGYRPKNPIRLDNYKRLLGWYRFPEGQEVECCFQKANGNLCNTKHQKGWVAEVADGSLTILGGDCGTDKFDADSSISRDIHRAHKELDQQEKLARLAGLLARRDEALRELSVAKAHLVGLHKTVASYRDRLGRVAWNALTHMHRTGNTTIRVLGLTPELRNDEGDVVRDRRALEINIVAFAGTSVCDEARVASCLEGLRRIEAAYKRAGEAPDANLKPKEVKALNAALADQPREIARARDLLDQLGRFEANDFTALAFTVADVGERIHLMQYGLERQGRLSSKNVAKKVLGERESALKQQYGVKHIRVR